MTPGARRKAARLPATGLLVLGVAGGVLAGCGPGPVQVRTSQHTAGACDRADALWPRQVARQDRRAVEPRSPDAAAWGDPAVIATCGWPEVAPTTDPCIDVDGVDWVAHELTDGVRFRTFGRSPSIEVLVPRAYAPEPLLLPAFGPSARALPTTGRTCS